MESLPCSAIVYRALLRRQWFDKQSNRVLPAAFVRRDAPKDDDGLSVGTATAEICAQTFNKCFAVGSLHVGKVKDLSLDVVPDELPDHANITGVPRAAEDVARAERLASQLAKQSRLFDVSHFAEK